jgi:hypothetical protein
MALRQVSQCGYGLKCIAIIRRLLLVFIFQIFWTAKDLVTITTSSSELPPLAVSSSRDEWEMSARSLFNKKRYAHAMQCFKRASLDREAAVADAYLLREQARDVPAGQPDSTSMRSKAFMIAAEAFVKCASSASVAVDRGAYYRTAAGCYKECNKPSEAAQHYLNAEEFDSATEVLCDARKFDEAMQVVRSHRDKMQKIVVDHIVTECACYYFRTEQLRQVSHRQKLPFQYVRLTSC